MFMYSVNFALQFLCEYCVTFPSHRVRTTNGYGMVREVREPYVERVIVENGNGWSPRASVFFLYPANLVGYG